MSRFSKTLAAAIIAVLALFLGVIREVQAGVIASPRHAGCRNLPVIKNLTGLTAREICDWMAAPKELTEREVNKLAATAKSPEDHLTIARYYRAKANGLDSKAAGYEAAAVDLKKGPLVKNLAAPGAASSFEFAAKGLREEANVARNKAATHEEMARTAVAFLF